MFGITIKRYCKSCNKDVEIHGVSTAIIVDSHDYYPHLECPSCGSNVSEDDEKIIDKARLDNRIHGVSML